MFRANNKVLEIQFSHSLSVFFKRDHLSTLTCFFVGLDQLLTFGKFICLKYSSGRESPSHMLLAPASTIIIRPEDTVLLRMLCLEPLFPSRSKSLAFCLKHRAKWDFKIHLQGAIRKILHYQ